MGPTHHSPFTIRYRKPKRIRQSPLPPAAERHFHDADALLGMHHAPTTDRDCRVTSRLVELPAKQKKIARRERIRPHLPEMPRCRLGHLLATLAGQPDWPVARRRL